MNLGHKIAFTFFVVVAMLFGIALCGYVNNRWDETVQPFSLAGAESRPEICMDAETREIIRGLMQDAVEVAFKQHVSNTFMVWMKDATGQPERAKTGVERGIKAFIDARKGVLEWAPPPCSG